MTRIDRREPPPAAAPPAETASGESPPPPRDRVCKHFVLDTNVLLHNPSAIVMFEEHEVVIPLSVIEELDRFKKGNDDTARNARHVIRQIDRLRKRGRLFDGVRVNDHGGTLRIDCCDAKIPFSLDLGVVDNRILAVAHALVQDGHDTVFLSKDINARVKADALGIDTEDFDAEKVDADWLYTGATEAVVPDDAESKAPTVYNYSTTWTLATSQRFKWE